MIFIGVDGGGTKTKLMMYEDNTKLSEVIVGPSMIDKMFLETSLENIQQGLDLLYRNTYVDKEIGSIFFGLSGNANEENISSFKTLLSHPKITENTIVTIANDMDIAFEAACSGRPSIAFIIGTGAVAYAKNENGHSHRVSGVNFYEGDLGSGYDIGLSSLKALSKSFDGRSEKTPFTIYLENRYKIKTYNDLSKLFFDYVPNRTKTASLARTAYMFLEQGDQTAVEIFKRAASDVAQMVKAIERNVDLKNKEIGVIGGLGNQPLYLQLIKDSIHSFNKEYVIHTADMDPCDGAIRLAKLVVKM